MYSPVSDSSRPIVDRITALAVHGGMLADRGTLAKMFRKLPHDDRREAMRRLYWIGYPVRLDVVRQRYGL